jgi:hypothetical protein
MNRVISASLASILLCIACSSSGLLDTSIPLTPDVILEHMKARHAKVSTFYGEGKMSIDTPGFSTIGTVEVKILKPDSLMIEVFSYLGMHVGKGLITKSDFTFLNLREFSVSQGSTNAGNLENILHFPIEFRDIIECLSGTLNVHDNGTTLSGVRTGNTYSISSRNEQFSAEYTIDLSYEAVTQYIRRDRENNIIEEFMFKDFRKKSGIYIPHMLKILHPKADENFVLVYDNIRLNDRELDFNLKIPEKAVRIRY